MFPPLVVFEEEARFWLAEGFHRLEAFTAAGFAEVPCVVHQGGLRDAILHSAGANADHGVRRSNADKRRAVLMLLRDEEWCSWSDREIARRCAVSDRFVNGLRHELTANIRSEATPRTYQDRHGNVSQMRTDRIGRKAEAEPGAPAEDKAPAHADAEAQPEAEEAQVAEPSPELAPVIRLTQELAQQFRREAEQVRGFVPGDASTGCLHPLHAHMRLHDKYLPLWPLNCINEPPFIGGL